MYGTPLNTTVEATDGMHIRMNWRGSWVIVDDETDKCVDGREYDSRGSASYAMVMRVAPPPPRGFDL